MSIPFFLEKMVFRPVTLKSDFVFQFAKDFEEINFEPEAGIRINALHFKTPNPKGIILYFHGNKDNLARWGDIASEFTIYNFDVIAIDYRGYGKSNGQVTEKSLFSDALFCYNKIITELKPDKVIIYGRSLGTGVASWLASMVNPAKLILETPYYDMHDLLGNYVPLFLYKHKFKFQLSSHSYLKNTHFPILIFHGTKDGVVPYKSGKKLYDSLTNSKKRMITLTGGKHNNLNAYKNYWTELDSFLAKA